MEILIRTDSSSVLGTGHLMRCLTLANRLREKGASVAFICRELPGNLINFAEDKGFPVRRLPPGRQDDCGLNQSFDTVGRHDVNQANDAHLTRSVTGAEPVADWMIVDHYALNEQWEKLIRPFAGRIMVIDDLANRRHDCDLLLDQNYHIGFEHRYDDKVPEHCRLFLGPRYALLRPEFLKPRSAPARHDGKIRRILVFFGGADSSNETGKTLEAIRSLSNHNLTFDVIIGPANLNRQEIEKAAGSDQNVRLHCGTSDMAGLMAAADLAVGAGGSTTWERCILGLPTIAIILAENQRSIIEAADFEGALFNLGWFSDVTAGMLADKIGWVLDNPEALTDMSAGAANLMHRSNRADDKSLVDSILEYQHAEH